MTERAWFHLAERLETAVSVEAFRAAFPSRRAGAFLLTGGGASARLDRHAFMGAEPIATLRAWRSRAPDGAVVRDARGRATARVVVDVHGDGADAGRIEQHDADAFAALRALLRRFEPPAGLFDRRYPFPLRAGLVGYIGYECGQLLERLPCPPRPSPGMPDLALGLYEWVIATSRETTESWLSVLGSGPTREEAERRARATRDRVLAAVARGTREVSDAADAAPRSSTRPTRSLDATRLEPALSRSEYVARVERAKDHIAAGDAFEICMTNAIRTPLPDAHAWTLFEELRRANPAPFAAFLDLPEGAVVSSSPERFLSLDERRIAESRPIKGTRPRGDDVEKDAALARELATSDKDRAENAMIVDLVRNDLGKVCRFGTVEAPELYVVEPYATVHQLVSTVRGELAPDRDVVDLLCACFPPGSMTGAPKIEAMGLLEGFEPVERGVYSGALGWIDLAGAMDLSVVIRTVVVKDGVATFSVGGAVVTDSDPGAEHEETEHKARAIVRALGVALSTEPSSSAGEETARSERRG